MAISDTKRALIAVGVMICLLAAGAGLALHRSRGERRAIVAGKTPDILSQLPPQAPTIAYVDMSALRNLRDSPLTAALGLANGGPQADREYQAFVRDTGFDYTRDLDKVAVAYWPASLAATPGGIGENRVLAIANGRFDEQKIRAYALRSGKVVTRGTQSLYEIPGDPPVSFEFLSPTRIALASGKNPESLLAIADPSAREPAMQALINRVSGASIFAVMRTDSLPNSFYANFKNSPQLGQLALSVKDLSLAGQPQGAEFQVALDAECDSAKSAIEITTLLDGFRMFGSMALADPKTRGQMTKEQVEFLTALLRQVKVTHDDQWVRLNLDVTPAMIRLATSR